MEHWAFFTYVDWLEALIITDYPSWPGSLNGWNNNFLHFDKSKHSFTKLHYAFFWAYVQGSHSCIFLFHCPVKAVLRCTVSYHDLWCVHPNSIGWSVQKWRFFLHCWILHLLLGSNIPIWPLFYMPSFIVLIVLPLYSTTLNNFTSNQQGSQSRLSPHPPGGLPPFQQSQLSPRISQVWVSSCLLCHIIGTVLFLKRNLRSNMFKNKNTFVDLDVCD